MLLRVFPAGSAVREPDRWRDDEPTLRHPGHTSVALFSPFSDRCQYLYRCVISVNLTGIHYITVRRASFTVSLTGSYASTSWRVRPGSVRHPGGQRFHSDDTVADVREYFPVNTRASNRGPRYHAIGRDGTRLLQQYSHILQAFLPVCGSLFRALLTSSSCSALTSPDNQLTATLQAAAFFWLGRCIHEGAVTDDDGAAVRLWREPEDRLPPTVAIAVLFTLFQQSLSQFGFTTRFSRTGYRTASRRSFFYL